MVQPDQSKQWREINRICYAVHRLKEMQSQILHFLRQNKNHMYDETSDAGSQYRCARVGRGIQPHPHPNPHTQTQII